MRVCGAQQLQENKLSAVARRTRAPSGVRRELFVCVEFNWKEHRRLLVRVQPQTTAPGEAGRLQREARYLRYIRVRDRNLRWVRRIESGQRVRPTGLLHPLNKLDGTAGQAVKVQGYATPGGSIPLPPVL